MSEAKEVKAPRAFNPLIYPLNAGDTMAVQRFWERVNKVTDEFRGTRVELPYVLDVPREHGVDSYVGVTMANRFTDNEGLGSLRGLLKAMHQIEQLREGSILTGGLSRLFGQGEDDYYMQATTALVDYKDPRDVEGMLIRKARGRPPSFEWGEWQVRYKRSDHIFANPSEVDLAYQVTVMSLIQAGRLMDSRDHIISSLSDRRRIFMTIYHGMVDEMIPPVSKNDVYGLEEQREDVYTNLYHPLIEREGAAMNTLLIGAPGVGKSFLGRLFLADQNVLTVKLSIEDFIRWFEVGIVPRLRRVSNELGFPLVVFIDDIERILENQIVVDEQGKTSTWINPADRSRALNLLERMQDAYGIRLLATLNHPDVEAAFLRRLNPVYFPLPKPEQRKLVLRKIIPCTSLREGEYEGIIADLTERTVGFNYHGITLIPDYLVNIQSRRGQKPSSDNYKKALDEALQKAKQRVSLKRLREFDEAAKKMLGMDTN